MAISTRNLKNNKFFFSRIDLQQKVIDIEKGNSKNDSNYDQAVSDKNNAFTLYGILTVSRCIVGLIRYFCLLWFCRTASINLHKAMVKGLMGATMSFFDNHFIGNILNRFSYDLNNIDEVIPFLFPALGSVSFICIISKISLLNVERYHGVQLMASYNHGEYYNRTQIVDKILYRKRHV